jgi:hypothetical protein
MQYTKISVSKRNVLFYKIVNGQVPDYLTELVPPTVVDTNNYNLRNRLNISQPSYRLSTHSFLYPHEQEAQGTKFDLNKSLLRELHLFLSLACNTLRYRSPKEM